MGLHKSLRVSIQCIDEMPTWKSNGRNTEWRIHQNDPARVLSWINDELKEDVNSPVEASSQMHQTVRRPGNSG